MLNKIFSLSVLAGIIFVVSCKNDKPAPAVEVVKVDTPKVITHKLVKLWETDTLFKTPESVLFDKTNNVLYVSNIDGKDPWAADGIGSIGKLGLDGKIINAEWVKGLQAPKGMGLRDSTLYVADLKRVVLIDVKSGKIKRQINIPSAKGLNDISIDPTGVLYVTDSEGKRLYRIEDGTVSMLLDTLAAPNGVLVAGRDLLVCNEGTLSKITKAKTLAVIADGLEGGVDGVEQVAEDEYLVSCWAGSIYYINNDGRKELLYDGKPEGKNTADIGYDAVNKIVYVPTFWKNSVIAFNLQ